MIRPEIGAEEPIQLDVVLVCRKRARDARETVDPSLALGSATERAYQKITRLVSIGLKLSRNDRRIAVISQFLSSLGPVTAESAERSLWSHQPEFHDAADRGTSEGGSQERAEGHAT